MTRKIRVSLAEYKYEVWDMMYEHLDEFREDFETRIINRHFTNERLQHIMISDLITELGKAYNKEMERLAKKWDIDLPSPQTTFPETTAAD